MSYATQVVGEWLTRVALLREATQGHTRPHKATQGSPGLAKTTQEGHQPNTKWEITHTIQFSSTLEIV